MTTAGPRAAGQARFSLDRALVQRIVDGVAEGEGVHLKVVFADGSVHHTVPVGEPDVTIVFHHRRAQWRMAFGGVFEFIGSYFGGDVDIVGEQGLRRLIHLGYRKPFGRFEHPLTLAKRRWLEWRQNNRDPAQAKRNATFHYGLPTFAARLALVEKDHRELADIPGTYDRFVSIGVHEHAGRDCNEAWIDSIAIGLRDGGIGLISATFNMRARPTNDCTIKHIFPGGFVPGLAQTLLLMDKHGLNLISVENRSYQYHHTLEQWLNNFEANGGRIRAVDSALVSEKFRRTWPPPPRRRGRDLRGRARDHQLPPHHVREGTFGGRGAVLSRRPLRRPWTVRPRGGGASPRGRRRRGRPRSSGVARRS